MAAVKYSRQREVIRTYLQGTTVHPTAETVYQNVRQLCPNISLGTVYRNLNLLVEQKEVLRLSCGDGSERFDGNPKPHYHFLCRACGAVSDLTLAAESLSHVNTLASVGFDGVIERHEILFTGLCPDCVRTSEG